MNFNKVKFWTKITFVLFWINLGSSTLQDISCMATYISSHKPSETRHVGHCWKSKDETVFSDSLLHMDTLVLAKVILISAKTCFEAIQKAAKQCSKLEQKSLIKLLVTEKWKPCEIYRRIGDVYGETCFRLNMGLPLQAQVEKTVHWVETYWFSYKENVPGTAVNKEGLAVTDLWDMKGPDTIDFLKNGATVNSSYYCQIRRQ